MGRGLIPGTIWKISCHNLFITFYIYFFQALTFILQKRSLSWQIAKINPYERYICSTCKYFCFEFCTMTLESVCKIYPRRWHLNENSYSRRHIHLSWLFRFKLLKHYSNILKRVNLIEIRFYHLSLYFDIFTLRPSCRWQKLN